MKIFLDKTAQFIFLFSIIFAMGFIIIKYQLNTKNYYSISPSSKILIIGHSHSECAFNDSLINYTTNLSFSGEAYFYTYFKLKKILEKNKQIKYILLEFSYNQISSEVNSWILDDQRLENSLPKYINFIDKDAVFYLLKNNFKSSLKSVGIAYKNNLSFLFSTNKNIFNQAKWGGYLYLKRNKTDSLLKIKTILKTDKYFKVSEKNTEYLNKIVNLCLSNNLKIIFVRTPLHPQYPKLNLDSFLFSFKNINYPNIPFWDFAKFKCMNSEFGDLEHLNFRGSKKFSLFFNELLIKGLIAKKESQKFIDSQINIIK